MCCCAKVFSHSPHSLAPMGYVWWGTSHSLLPLLPPGSKDCFRPHCWGCLGCPQLPLEVTWSSMSQSWKVHLQKGDGILAWVPVLSCIWCVVHPSLQPLSGRERLGWVVFAFPVPLWEGTLVSQWLTLSYQHCLGRGSSRVGHVKHELQCSSSESWTKPYLAFLDN